MTFAIVRNGSACNLQSIIETFAFKYKLPEMMIISRKTIQSITHVINYKSHIVGNANQEFSHRNPLPKNYTEMMYSLILF